MESETGIKDANKLNIESILSDKNEDEKADLEEFELKFLIPPDRFCRQMEYIHSDLLNFISKKALKKVKL